MEIRTEITYSVSDKPKDGKAYLRIRKWTYEFSPKQKFVRRKEKRRTISNTLLGEFEITVPYTLEKEIRSRSWLGSGLQQDDINCYEEWEEEMIVYNKPELEKFIAEKLSLFNHPNQTTPIKQGGY